MKYERHVLCSRSKVTQLLELFEDRYLDPDVPTKLGYGDVPLNGHDPGPEVFEDSRTPGLNEYESRNVGISAGLWRSM